MASPNPKAPRLELVVVAGPDEGLRLAIEPPGPVPIGRSAKGLALGDPLVSIHHAELTWEEGRWRLRDVGSATGTRIAGRELAGGQALALQVGDEIELGESRVRLARPRGIVLPIVGAATFVAMSAGIAAVLAVAQNRSVAVEKALTWHEPIRQGELVAPTLALSRPFLRHRGLDPARLRISRVSDFDTDGRDEVWLAHDAERVAITFEDDGSWVELGRFPAGCIDASRSGETLLARGFPVQRCPGRTYEYVDEAYRVSHQEGVVVWVREPAVAPAEGEAPAPRRLVPYTVTSRRPERLAGFLATRGVSEPVAWLVCEGAFPEIRPQVRTARGALRPLSHGCHTGLRVEGQVAGDVVAVAFTAAARESLLDDLERYFAGSADGLFASAADRERLDLWRAEPGFLKGGTRVEFDGPDHFFHPMAGEGPLPRASDRLLPASGSIPAPPALTATLLTEGVAPLDPPGCSQLELHTGSWTCSLGSACVSGSTFLTVREVGCGEPRTLLTVPYAGGVVDASTDELEVRAVVDATAGPDAAEVWQARVTYRLSRR